MKKNILALLTGVLCLNVNCAYSQKQDYIATDSSIVLGIKLLRDGPRINSQYVRLKGKDAETKYTPEQIREYGFKEGTVYESADISLNNETRRVFLERLVSGSVTLYRYADRDHRTYYLRKDSSDLRELHEDLGAMKALSEDCELMDDAIRLATYSKGSLQRLVLHYNRCMNRPFPSKRVGIIAGWRITTLKPPPRFDNTASLELPQLSSGSPVLGIFADLPLKWDEFSLHPELFYTRSTFASNRRDTQTDVDALIKLSTVQMPVFVRYTTRTPYWRLFVDAGLYFAYNLENISDVYYSTVEGNTISIERPYQEKLLANIMFGYSLGAGVQRRLNYKNSVSSEFRYTWATGLERSTLIMNGIDLVVGFTF